MSSFARYEKFLLISALVAISITFLIIRFKIHPAATPLALHYSVVSGVDLYGPGKNLYQLPLAGFAIICLNLVFSRLLGKQEFLRFLAAVASGLSASILLLATLLLLRVN